MKNGNIGINTNQGDLYVFFLDQAWDHMSKSYVPFREWVSCNLFELMKVNLVGNIWC